MEDEHDKEYKWIKEEPIGPYDVQSLFLGQDKTKVSNKDRKAFIKENKRVKAKIRKRLTGDDKVAATNWKVHTNTPHKEAVQQGKLIPRTSPVYKMLNFEDPAMKFTDRLTVPKDTPYATSGLRSITQEEAQNWRLLNPDLLMHARHMAKGGPQVMGIPVKDTKKEGGKRRTRKKRGGCFPFCFLNRNRRIRATNVIPVGVNAQVANVEVVEEDDDLGLQKVRAGRIPKKTIYARQGEGQFERGWKGHESASTPWLAMTREQQDATEKANKEAEKENARKEKEMEDSRKAPVFVLGKPVNKDGGRRKRRKKKQEKRKQEKRKQEKRKQKERKEKEKLERNKFLGEKFYIVIIYMPSLGKNIAIAQPKGPSARMAEAKNIGTLGTFGVKQNSTINSKFDSSNGLGNSDHNRKLQAVMIPEVNKQQLTSFTREQKKYGARSSSQLRVETNLGSMDRMARLKAQAMKKSRA